MSAEPVATPKPPWWRRMFARLPRMSDAQWREHMRELARRAVKRSCCAQCGAWIIARDDDALVCIQCGGRNRREKLPAGQGGPPPKGAKPIPPPPPPPPMRTVTEGGRPSAALPEPSAYPPMTTIVPPAIKLRGRISRSSNLKRGRTSVIIHFGVDEPRAKELLQPDTLVEVEVRQP